MRDLLFPSSPAHRGALAEAARLQARGFVMECRAILAMYETADPEQRDFVHGDIAGTLHLAPRTAQGKASQALELMAHPALVAALEHGRLGIGHALAVLGEISHLAPPTAAAVLAEVLGDGSNQIEDTAGELRAKAKNAGQKEVAALLHALGCERINGQAVLECPVDRAVDVHTAAQAGVWSVDVRMPIAVALGLSDHPALLAGYGPIGADQARALLPAADLVKACVDSRTGEVLAVDRPVRAKTWQADDPALTRVLREQLVAMATSGGTVEDLTTDGYVPSEALGRLVDLRDVTSVFPGDATPARRTERDHRLPYPLGPTDEQNLQNIVKRWHRAKHRGWHTRAEPDGTITWTSPSNGVYRRRPRRTIPPKIPPGSTLAPLPDDE